MEYVMVPVPEEHVVDVMLHVARLVAKASVAPWTDDALADLFDEVDEASRSVLSLVARATSAGKDISEDDASGSLELSVREVREIVRDVNEASARADREPVIGLRDATVVLRNGRSAQRRVFVMTDPVARALRAHERASLADGPAAATPTDPPE